ncbi:MAG: LacI family DNA-binding transcriptional regulator, partial [Burkholderiaceae bacterium]|nr:LacI family DNA-binding transcriptional regulator [Burkholderiaceae bacterium]
MKRLTIKDVARQAGVSIGTASRVINGAPNVEVENKARVLAAIEALGFLPSRAAQSMRRGSSQEIGIIVRDITTPVLAGFVRAAQTVFEQSGYILLISSADNHKERELELLNKLRRRRIDG